MATFAAPLAALDRDAGHQVDTIRSMRALLHGFVGLELRRGFGLSNPIERSLAHAVDLIVGELELNGE